MKRLLLAALVLASAAAALPAHAHSSVVFGFHFGIPLYGPPAYYYPPPYPYPYYYPAPVYQAPSVIVAPPPPETTVPAPADYSWYYCESSRGYYPYVRECPGGWQRVPASPPPAR